MGCVATHLPRLCPDSEVPQKSILNVLLYGLDGVGKTSSLYRMKLGEMIETVPTATPNMESFDVHLGSPEVDWTVKIWDVGFRGTQQQMWRQCHTNADCVIFILDSTDRRRIGEARDELLSLMFEEHFVVKCCKFLIFANKQDSCTAMTVKEVEAHLDIPRELCHRCRVFPSSALSGIGLLEGLEWLAGIPDPDGPPSRARGKNKDAPQEDYEMCLKSLSQKNNPNPEFNLLI